jgi:hypothetical protein
MAAAIGRSVRHCDDTANGDWDAKLRFQASRKPRAEVRRIRRVYLRGRGRVARRAIPAPSQSQLRHDRPARCASLPETVAALPLLAIDVLRAGFASSAPERTAHAHCCPVCRCPPTAHPRSTFNPAHFHTVSPPCPHASLRHAATLFPTQRQSGKPTMLIVCGCIVLQMESAWTLSVRS